MKTEPQNEPAGARIVSPPEWELTTRRMEDLFLDFHLALCRPLPDECEWADWLAAFRSDLLETDEGVQAFFLVGRGDGEVRGWVKAEMKHVDGGWRPSPAPFLSNLIVLPKWRGRGYGGFLLRRGENYFRGRGSKEVYLTCDAGIAPWYARQGYETCTPTTEDGHAWMEPGLYLQRKNLNLRKRQMLGLPSIPARPVGIRART